MDLRSVYVTQKNGHWIAIWQPWIRLGTTLHRPIGVGHVAGFPWREAASKLHVASTLPDKDVDSDHARFLDWATADHTTELMPSSPLPSLVVTFHFPTPFSLPTGFFS
jgi:hypothetical protein